MSPKSLVHRFAADCQGGSTMIVGLSIFLLLGALGVAIDSARGYTAKSKLQGVVDAAALAGAKACGESQDNAPAGARVFFDANDANGFMAGRITNFNAAVDQAIPLIGQRATIAGGIEALEARSGGGTQTRQGLVRDARTSSPRWRGYRGSPTPADMPLDDDEFDLIKAIVFMTDGIAHSKIETAY